MIMAPTSQVSPSERMHTEWLAQYLILMEQEISKCEDFYRE